MPRKLATILMSFSASAAISWSGLVINRRGKPMTPSTRPPTAPVSPTLIGAVFDCLAHVPMCERLEPDMLIRIARAIGCSERERPALVIRVRAAAIVFADPRWDHWLGVLRAGDADMRRANDAALLRIIAELPLAACRRFPPDLFFRALLALAQPCGRG